MTRRFNINDATPFGPTGAVVHARTYSRTKPNGDKETWQDTTRRVAEGNLALVYGERDTWSFAVRDEYDRLVHFMDRFAIIPAGRHLWATGVRQKGRQYLMNCLSHETEVVTDGGIFSIGDLVGQGVRVRDGNGAWTSTVVKSFGVQPLRRVTFQSGKQTKVVHATGGHRWMAGRTTKDALDFVTTDDLRPGYVIPKRFGRQGVLPNVSPIGVQAGFIFGDGTASDTYGAQVFLCGDKDSALMEFFPTVSFTRHSEGNLVSSSSFPASWKCLPDMSEGRSFLMGWLAGYLAADGSVDDAGHASIYSSRLENVEFVRSLAAVLGIGTNPIKMQMRVGYGTEETALYGVSFVNGSLPDEFFLIPAHRERVGMAGRRARLRSNWKVVSVEATERVEEVYCVEVPSTQTFLLADGLMTGNCWVSHWSERLSDHFEFTFMRLMEGGGVGANYSSKYLAQYGRPRRPLDVHVVCDPMHPNYEEMLDAGILSEAYSHEWEGAFAVEDSREGWALALVDLIDTFMTGGEVKHRNRVYDVSRVRAKGMPLRTFGGYASGPQPFARMMLEVGKVMSESHWGCEMHLSPIEAMEIDHAIAECVVSGGNRRSARMSQVHWKDPFIQEFLLCKADPSKHWTTNISVEIDDEFLAALVSEPTPDSVDEWGCVWPQYGPREHAALIHEAVVKGMLENGEPGYWNSSLSRVGDEHVVSTNPCSEITLEPWEPCNLGHINLDAFAPTRADGPHDSLGLLEAHKLMTRFLIRATYGDVNDPKSREVLARNRRIGVGHLGVQGFWAKKGYRYSEVSKHQAGPKFLKELYAIVRQEAHDYAFELRIPSPIKVTTVAPTGSIAKLPGVSEGIHPIYARTFIRRVRFSAVSPEESATVRDFADQGYDVETCQYDKSGNTLVVQFPTLDKLVAEVEAMGFGADLVQSADEIDADDMLAFQEMYQRHWADNSVSFTVNIPSGKYAAAELGAVLTKWLPSLKGTTCMVDESRPQAPYERLTREQFDRYAVTRIEDGTDEECASGACPIR